MKSLSKMLSRQKEFYNKILKKRYDKTIDELDIYERQAETREQILNLMMEASEVLNCTNFKTHRDEQKEIDLDNINEEQIDTLKYLLNTMLLWNMNEKRVFEMFDIKSNIVDFRYNQEILLKNFENEPLVVCDIDGVLNEWPLPFINFANDKYSGEIGELLNQDLEDWNDFTDLPITLQDRIKHEYRQSGLKAKQIVNSTMKEFLLEVSKKKYKILILSSRPYEKYFRIFNDTKVWLDKNKIPYDGLVFDTRKHRKLIRNLKNVKLFIDDDINYVENISSLGIKSCLYVNPYLPKSKYQNANSKKYFIFDPKKDQIKKLLKEI